MLKYLLHFMSTDDTIAFLIIQTVQNLNWYDLDKVRVGLFEAAEFTEELTHQIWIDSKNLTLVQFISFIYLFI